jgi:hypothetical protein
MNRNCGSGFTPRFSDTQSRHKAAPTGHPRTAGFTLVELLVGMSLALMVMTAVLTTYVTLGRNFTRLLGISSSNQPTLESQARRTLAYFTQDVRMASGISGTPSATSLTLTLPTSTGTTTVTYAYDSTAQTLTRTPASGSALTLHSGLLGFTFNYYDSSGNPYTSYTNYLPGIKQLSFTLTSQAGSSVNGTLTQVYETDSPRLLLRNKALLQ